MVLRIMGQEIMRKWEEVEEEVEEELIILSTAELKIYS